MAKRVIEARKSFRWAVVVGICLTAAMAVAYWMTSPPPVPPAVPSPNALPLQSVVVRAMQATLKGEPQLLAFPSLLHDHNHKILIGQRDGTVIDFEVGSDGRLNYLASIVAHSQTIHALAHAPHQRQLASSDDSTINIVDIATKQRIGRLSGHTATVNSILYSTDGGRILSSAKDGTVRLWNVETESELANFKVGQDRDDIGALAWSLDGSRFAVARTTTGSHCLVIWDRDQQRELRVLVIPNVPTQFIAFSRDGKTLLSLIGDAIKVWNVETGQELQNFGQGLTAAALSPSGLNLFAGNRKGHVEVWNAETGELIQEFTDQTQPAAPRSKADQQAAGAPQSIVAVALSSDGLIGVSATQNKEVRTWKLPPPLPPPGQMRSFVARSPVHAVAFSSDGFFGVTGDDKWLRVWNLKGAEFLYDYGYEIDARISCVAFSPNLRRILYATDEAGSQQNFVGIRVHGTVTTRQSFGDRDERHFAGQGKAVLAAAFLPDGERILTADAAGVVRFAELKNERELSTFDLGQAVHQIALSAKGERAIVVGDDHIARLWNLTEQSEMMAFDTHGSKVREVALSANSRRGATISDDQAIRVWDIETGTCLATLEGHPQTVNAVALSADGAHVLSGGDDGVVRYWSIAPLGEVRQFLGHIAAVQSVAISPDGKLGLSGGFDGSVRLWDLKVPANTPQP